MNLAIISTNKDKYSETFIHSHVRLLPSNVHFLFDGYLPKQVSIDKGITSQFLVKVNDKKRIWPFNKKLVTDKERLEQAIENYLNEHNIDVLLCEYGPSGVEMMPIAKKCKIPLVTHFHGYDAFRDDILNSYGKQYQELFSSSATVIAVSKQMVLQLQKLGCQMNKIQYLCYGVDTNLFQSNLNKKTDLVFVACGRFVKKKAPQLTLSAFELVLRQNPLAKLVMVGDGELLQSCQELTKTLGMQQSVEFKGVLTQTKIAELFCSSFAFIQHSITTNENDSEGTPLIILEAMSAGLPIVSTKHGGIVDVVKEGETGFLVNEGDVAAMASRMNYLISNTQVAKRLGEKGSELVNKEYNFKVYTQRLFEILKQSKK